MTPSQNNAPQAQLEERYIVIKLSKIDDKGDFSRGCGVYKGDRQIRQIKDIAKGAMLERVDCIVCERDWPMYQQVEDLILGNVRSTPSATWRVTGEEDPHGSRYDCERADLVLGHLTDDQLANGAFMNYNGVLDIEKILSKDPNYHPPIAWMTAVKDRLRWLSRKLEEASAAKV